MKEIGMPRKGRSREFREIHSGNPERAFWDDFPWRMRTANVDTLGTGDILLFAYEYSLTQNLCENASLRMLFVITQFLSDFAPSNLWESETFSRNDA